MLKTYQDDRIPKRHCYVTRPQHVTLMVLEAYKITVMLPGLQIFTVLLPGRNSQYVNFLLLLLIFNVTLKVYYRQVQIADLGSERS